MCRTRPRLRHTRIDEHHDRSNEMFDVHGSKEEQ